MVEDGFLTYMEPPERDGAKVDGPDIIGDLFESNVITSEQMGDIDPGRVPTDAAVGRDFADLKMERVVGLCKLLWEGPGRGFVNGGRWLLAESLVKADFIEVDAEGVETATQPWPPLQGPQWRTPPEGPRREEQNHPCNQ